MACGIHGVLGFTSTEEKKRGKKKKNPKNPVTSHIEYFCLVDAVRDNSHHTM